MATGLEWMDRPKTITEGEYDALAGDRITLNKLRVAIRKITPEMNQYTRQFDYELFCIVCTLTSVVEVDDRRAAEDAATAAN